MLLKLVILILKFKKLAVTCAYKLYVMRVFVFIISLFVSSLLFAQENYTIKAAGENLGVDYLLLPFDPNYYMSDVDVEIGEYNKMKSLEIREYFREELDKKLYITIKNKKKIQSLLMSGGNNTIKDLSFVLESVKYEYVPLENLTLNKNEKPKKSYPSQLYKKPETQSKYMRATCASKEAFTNLFEKNKSNYIVSINQFEIKNNFDDQINIQQNTHTRKINVHYNVLDKTGKTVYGGIASSEFANNVLDIAEIVKINFDKIAEEITSHLPIN